MAGKGSSPRPYSVDPKTFSSNWDNIFNKKSHDACGTPECCGVCDIADVDKNWYLVAINPWYKIYFNPKTNKQKTVKYN